MPEPLQTLLVAALLPCPLQLEWLKTLERPLPPASGGYSAMATATAPDQFWLLSDLPSGELSRWTLPGGTAVPRRLQTLHLPPRRVNHR